MQCTPTRHCCTSVACGFASTWWLGWRLLLPRGGGQASAQAALSMTRHAAAVAACHQVSSKNIGTPASEMCCKGCCALGAAANCCGLADRLACAHQGGIFVSQSSAVKQLALLQQMAAPGGSCPGDGHATLRCWTQSTACAGGTCTLMGQMILSVQQKAFCFHHRPSLEKEGCSHTISLLQHF